MNDRGFFSHTFYRHHEPSSPHYASFIFPIVRIFKLNIKTIVDPKPQNINLYNDVYAITPNLKEINRIISSNDIDEGARELSEQINTIVLVTIGPEGIILIDGKEKYYL